MRVFSVNVGTLRGRSGEVVVHIRCVQETRFRGKSVRIVSGKAEEHKLFWIGNEKGFRRV